MRKFWLPILALLVSTVALAQKSTTDLITEINTNLPNNTTGAITPAILRTTLIDIVNSYLNTVSLCSPSVSGSFPTYNASTATWTCSTTGGTGSAATLSGTGTFSGPTQLNMPVTAATATSHIILSTDDRSLITGTNASPQSYTLAQAGVSFPARWQTTVCSYGAGTVTVNATVSTINGASSVAIPSLDCYAITSDGTNYQAFEQGLFTRSQADAYFTKGLALVTADSGNFQINSTINGTVQASNNFAASTVWVNDPVVHTGSNNFAMGITSLMPGSSATSAGGNTDGALLLSSQQTNYLTTTTNAEVDTLWTTNYQGVNATGNAGTFAVVKRATAGNIPGNTAATLEGDIALVNASGQNTGTIAQLHYQLGQLFFNDSTYGAVASFEGWVGTITAGVRVDTFDNSAGTAGTAPDFTCAYEGRNLRDTAKRYLCIDTTGKATLGITGSTVGKVALANATTGTITLQPATGALGSTVQTLPVATGIIPVVASAGTFACTGGGTITISDANFAAADLVIISLNAQGGVISTPPAMKTASPTANFQVLCGAADTSTYNYGITKR